MRPRDRKASVRLIKARIQGYGRLSDSKINLDGKVIAVVGPNEAGKTTLLKALALMSSSESLPMPQRSRATSVTDDSVITSVDFVLGATDLDELLDLDLDEVPTSLTVDRLAEGGAVMVAVKPVPAKNRKPLRISIDVMSRYMANPNLADFVNQDTIYADPGADSPRDYAGELSQLVGALEVLYETSPDSDSGSDLNEQLQGDASALLNGTSEEPEALELYDAISNLVEWLKIEDPEPRVRELLWSRTPEFLLFGEGDRTLSSSYTFDESLLANIPPALSNLVNMAGLDLSMLFEYHRSEDFGPRNTVIMQANARLRETFKTRWKQSHLSVRIEIDGNLLRIMIWEGGDSITVFSERSAGLQMFVALAAFLSVRGTSRPPILLVDEAENHLHIDAQADLVNMFMTQEQAAKVIYTTHSPACLPPDLGSGIRSVVPRADGQQISDIRNSFWSVGPGFAPLMMAMGAAAAAFTPARCVVLAEGASEMILLPTLIRIATGQEVLSYQVAPGLSEAPASIYPQLDFEGAKVAYLVDGDEGGKSLKKALLKSGVPDTLVITINVPGIENALEPSVYEAAVRSLIAEINPRADLSSMPKVSDPKLGSWASIISKWAKEMDYSMPSKVAVAAWLVSSDEILINDEVSSELKAVHEALMRVFI